MRKLILFVLVSFCSLGLRSQNFALSTNFLDYANFGTLNIDAALAIAQHWSLNATVKYNPFSFNSEDGEVVQKQRSVSSGGKYWPWHSFSGWWLSALVKYQEYNSGGLRSALTSEGDRFGAGFGAGYTMMLSTHLNLDFGAVVWGGYDSFTQYACPTCGRVVAKGSRAFFLPSDISVALTYIF